MPIQQQVQAGGKNQHWKGRTGKERVQFCVVGSFVVPNDLSNLAEISCSNLLLSLYGEAGPRCNNQIGESMKGTITRTHNPRFLVENQMIMFDYTLHSIFGIISIYRFFPGPTRGRQEVELRFFGNVGLERGRSSPK